MTFFQPVAASSLKMMHQGMAALHNVLSWPLPRRWRPLPNPCIRFINRQAKPAAGNKRRRGEESDDGSSSDDGDDDDSDDAPLPGERLAHAIKIHFVIVWLVSMPASHGERCWALQVSIVDTLS